MSSKIMSNKLLKQPLPDFSDPVFLYLNTCINTVYELILKPSFVLICHHAFPIILILPCTNFTSEKLDNENLMVKQPKKKRWLQLVQPSGKLVTYVTDHTVDGNKNPSPYKLTNESGQITTFPPT